MPARAVLVLLAVSACGRFGSDPQMMREQMVAVVSRWRSPRMVLGTRGAGIVRVPLPR